MKLIGRSLAFYLKYLDEMEALYEDGDAEGFLSELPNRAEISDMIDKIGGRASEQVFDLLTEAIERVKKTFPKDIAHDNGEGKTSIKNNWSRSLWIWTKGKSKNNPKKWQIGISFEREYNGYPSFITWIWAKGGQKSEIRISEILGKKKNILRSKDLGWISSGTVAIGALPIYVQNVDNFEIDSEPFMAEIERMFRELSPHLKEIFSKTVVG